MKNLFDHYEEWGDVSFRLLAQEERFQVMRGARAAAAGRCTPSGSSASSRAELARLRGRARAAPARALIASCDVSVWKVLRRDLGLPRAEAEQAVRGLIEALCAKGGHRMAKFLCYTSPARGHLFPTVPILLELRRRGHEVAVLHASQPRWPRVPRPGSRARASSPEAIEAIELDDYGAASSPGGAGRAVRMFAARAAHEVPDLQAAIRRGAARRLLVDFNCWGAAAVAERSGVCRGPSSCRTSCRGGCRGAAVGAGPRAAGRLPRAGAGRGRLAASCTCSTTGACPR